MAKSIFENVAIVGGSGNLASQITKALLSESKLNITIIQRAGSATPPTESPRVQVKSGDYATPDFFTSALSGQDILINALGLGAPPTLTESLYDAAVSVGIKWIVPGGFGCDFLDDELTAKFPLMGMLRQGRESMVERGIPYTGFINGPWLDYNIKGGLFSIDVSARKATLYTGGDAKFNTTTLAQVGLGVARVLARIADGDKEKDRNQYKNTEVYLSSFLVSQKDILESVQRATGTTAHDWEIDSTTDVTTYISEGGKMLQEGNMAGIWNLLFGNLYAGVGGDYETEKGLGNESLGIPNATLDDEVRRALGASGVYKGHIGFSGLE